MGDKRPGHDSLDGKMHYLREYLRRFRKVAVAFSGGVDSTVLLDNCCKVFAPQQIVALHVRSCLQAESSAIYTADIVKNHFSKLCVYSILDCNPLEWGDFIANTGDRCYFCKKKTYGIILEEAARNSCDVILDGTNTDDLNEHRPGLKVLKEYGIVSPFLIAAISKADIRRYAQEEGLPNHDLPSNSCLATRIQHNQSITPELLNFIEDAEDLLASLGFAGTRIRPQDKHVFLEIQEKDFAQLVTLRNRTIISEYFQAKGSGAVYLRLIGR